ncbi:unnamed protein product [Prorocentrum cordatum]|uniref:MORN repeat-containing protein 5 n=1 Tax=Prorocentrum cordatum TaxID=2364126 RepID=A0ABN9S531_9DINO|nr:unnamed protein product [Polarella glacialis]
MVAARAALAQQAQKANSGMVRRGGVPVHVADVSYPIYPPMAGNLELSIYVVLHLVFLECFCAITFNSALRQLACMMRGAAFDPDRAERARVEDAEQRASQRRSGPQTLRAAYPAALQIQKMGLGKKCFTTYVKYDYELPPFSLRRVARIVEYQGQQTSYSVFELSCEWRASRAHRESSGWRHGDQPRPGLRAAVRRLGFAARTGRRPLMSDVASLARAAAHADREPHRAGRAGAPELEAAAAGEAEPRPRSGSRVRLATEEDEIVQQVTAEAQAAAAVVSLTARCQATACRNAWPGRRAAAARGASEGQPRVDEVVAAPTAAPPTAMQRVQRVQPTTGIQAADGAVRLLKQQLSRVEAVLYWREKAAPHSQQVQDFRWRACELRRLVDEAVGRRAALDFGGPPCAAAVQDAGAPGAAVGASAQDAAPVFAVAESERPAAGRRNLEGLQPAPPSDDAPDPEVLALIGNWISMQKDLKVSRRHPRDKVADAITAEPLTYEKVVLPDSSTFEGQLRGDDRHGWGKFTWDDGGAYEGQFDGNDMHGQGTYRWADGSNYVGVWTRNQMGPTGTMTTDGRKYMGEFRDGRKHGEGRIFWRGRARGPGSGPPAGRRLRRHRPLHGQGAHVPVAARGPGALDRGLRRVRAGEGGGGGCQERLLQEAA